MISRMTLADLDTVLDWAADEGWNPGLEDAATFLATDPEGFFVTTREGAPALPKDQVEAAYDRYIVPTPGRVYWNGVVKLIKIDWAGQNRAPLLLIGGGKDLIAEASMTRAIYRKQSRAASLTERRIFETALTGR